jgi:hypothetical protein
MVLRIGQTIGPLMIGILFTLGNLSAAFGAGAGVALLMFIGIINFIKPPKIEMQKTKS